MEYRVRLPNGKIKSLNDRTEIVSDYGKETLIGTVHDITVRKKDEETISYYAYYDTLTKLPNRRSFIQRFHYVLEKVKKENSKLALMFVDLDRFKHVNDAYGHKVGDMVLCSTASRIKNCMRDTDLIASLGNRNENSVARLAGDEFTVLLCEEKAVENVSVIARRLIEECSKPFIYEQYKIYISASVGVALYPEDSDSVEVLLQHADLAMYHAKEIGRNNYRFFSEKLNQHQMTRLNLESDLRRALRAEFNVASPVNRSGMNVAYAFQDGARLAHSARLPRGELRS